MVNRNTRGTDKEGKSDKPALREWTKPLWFLTTVGWYVALSILIPTGIGYWLDRPTQLNTHPLYTLIGFGLGTVAAFFGLYQMLRRFQREQMERNKEIKEVK